MRLQHSAGSDFKTRFDWENTAAHVLYFVQVARENSLRHICHVSTVELGSWINKRSDILKEQFVFVMIFHLPRIILSLEINGENETNKASHCFSFGTLVACLKKIKKKCLILFDCATFFFFFLYILVGIGFLDQ